MTHLFVAPHPDDIALSCGGLVVRLRELGRSVTILTVFSGVGEATGLTRYQREALGFGTAAGQPIEGTSRQAAAPTAALLEARVAREIAAARRGEDERYATFVGAAIDWLDLPDAVFRGYDDDDQLMALPRPDDVAPVHLVVQAIHRLEPERVYLPLGIGGHVDHQLVRGVGATLLQPEPDEARPEPVRVGAVAYYEDFPYAWLSGFSGLADLPSAALAGLPTDMALEPEIVDIGTTIERKIRGIELYASQLDRLFLGRQAMGEAVRDFGAGVAARAGRVGFAERYWAAVPR